MTTQNTTNNSTTTTTTTTTTTKQKKRPNRLVKYILKHKVTFSLLFALIVVFIWGQWQISRLEKKNAALIETHQEQMDSLQKDDYLLVSKVFSWAVRSDMLRSNFEQANLYIESIIKVPIVTKAYAINSENNTIILSSNKEEIGLPVSDVLLLQPTETTMQNTPNGTRFVSPIVGLNRQIGISVIETTLK